MAGNKKKTKGIKAKANNPRTKMTVVRAPMPTSKAVTAEIAPTEADAPSNGANTAPVVLAIKVNFTLNTPDGLRRIMFGLEKDTQGNVVIWKISFQLFERSAKSDAFGDAIADLEVEVDHQLHPQAAAAATSGLTPPQAAHAAGPAGDDAKAAQAGEIDQADAEDTVQNTLAV